MLLSERVGGRGGGGGAAGEPGAKESSIDVTCH